MQKCKEAKFISKNMDKHESYVSLEVAELLKKAGFDWSTHYSYDLYLYNTEGEKRVIDGFASTFCNEHNGLASMPTIEVAQRWLREVMKIEVFVEPFIGFYKYVVEELKENGIYSEGRSESYEEALEAGIKKALELILEKGK